MFNKRGRKASKNGGKTVYLILFSCNLKAEITKQQ